MLSEVKVPRPFQSGGGEHKASGGVELCAMRREVTLFIVHDILDVAVQVTSNRSMFDGNSLKINPQDNGIELLLSSGFIVHNPGSSQHFPQPFTFH
jgi:hypothetical protein